MFKRKDESGTDSTNAVVASATGESIAPAAPAAATSTAASATPSPGSTFAAAAAAPARAASEPARAPASTIGNFRSSPIAEFNRSATARASEPARTTTASAPATSFGGAPEKNTAKASRRVLTVGNDILLKGEIATCDRLVIEGRVEAKLSEVHTVEIAECGSFKGTAEVEDAEISGVFEGDLIVRNRIVIYATGEVRGNISYGEIEIERGGKLTGQIKSGNAKGSKLADADIKLRKETVAA